LHEEPNAKPPLEWLEDVISAASPLMKPFDALVVDSLNVIQDEGRRGLFNKIMESIQSASTERSRGPKIVLFILEGDPGSKEHAHWEYVVDVSLVFRRRDREKMYLTYSLEIAKARYQQHARGEHVTKVVGKRYKLIGGVNAPRVPSERGEGGLVIFPSVHYHRSAAGSWNSVVHGPRPVAGEIDIAGDRKRVRELRAIVPAAIGKSPFPRGECTALLGKRGAMKSHIGMHFLVEGLRRHEHVLLVSLRDAPSRLLEIMKTISHQEYKPSEHEQAPKIEDNENLHLLSFQSGCVTPEEFLSRIVAEIDAFPIQKVLICAEDQLAVRYPLCNAESLFSEAMVDAMKCRNITTVVVGVDDVEQAADHQGLAALSTLVIKFERAVVSSEAYEFSKEEWDGWCAKNLDMESPQAAKEEGKFNPVEPKDSKKWFSPDRKEIVVTLVRAVRVPAGMPGGQTGTLRLDYTSGLHLIPLPAYFPPARLLE
jgi:KaiC/GvpD/RAD55 family RecA-like ATPase